MTNGKENKERKKVDTMLQNKKQKQKQTYTRILIFTSMDEAGQFF